MTKRELTAMILKLLGVYVIVKSLAFLQPMAALVGGLGYQTDKAPNQMLMCAIMSIPFALTAGAGVILLACSRGLACVLVKDDGDAMLTTSVRAEEIQAIGFSIVAVLVFLSAVPRLAQFIGYAWFVASLRSSRAPMEVHIMSLWQNGLSFVIQCGLAIVLFFRARGLANLWHRIQVGKYVKVED